MNEELENKMDDLLLNAAENIEYFKALEDQEIKNLAQRLAELVAIVTLDNSDAAAYREMAEIFRRLDLAEEFQTCAEYSESLAQEAAQARSWSNYNI